MLKISLAFCFLISIHLSAQEFNQAIQFGDLDNPETLLDCVSKSDDGIITTGIFSNPMDIDPGPSELLITPFVQSSTFIQSLNSGGGLDWAVVLDVQNAALDVDSNDDLLLTGSFSGTVDFDPGENESLLTTENPNALFILKLSSSGEFLWVKMIDNVNGSREDIKLSNENKIMISASFAGSIDVDPGEEELILTTQQLSGTFIVQLDDVGNLEWAQQIESPQLWYGSYKNQYHAYDNSGNLYFGTTFFQYIDLTTDIVADSIPANNLSYENIIIKYAPNGEILWTKIFGSNTEYEYVRSIDVDSEGSVYCVGRFNLYIDFDEGSFGDAELTAGFASPTDGYIVKYNADGSYAWSAVADGQYYADIYSVRVLQDDKVVCLGPYSGSLDVDLTAEVNTSTAISPSGFFMFTLNPDSTQVNYRLYQGFQTMTGGWPLHLIVPFETGDGYSIASETYSDIIQFENAALDTLVQNPVEGTKITLLQYGTPVVTGCTADTACNYNPSAILDDGSCLEFSPTDLDGDCYTGVSDILILLSYFGCQSECEEADLNNDGIVNVQDIIIWIGG